jgi:hypothetical protein
MLQTDNKIQPNMDTQTIIAREALQLVKNAEQLTEKEGLPYLKMSACLLKTATDISYGLSLEDAVKRQFDPDEQFETYAVLSNILKEAADTPVTKVSEDREPSLADRILSNAATGAAYGAGTTGLGFGGVTRLIPHTPLSASLQSAGVGTVLGASIGGTLGAGKGVVEHLYHKYQKSKENKTVNSKT